MKALTDITRKADLAKLRRIALSNQGLTQTQPFGRGHSGAAKVVAHLGYVQIDTISVVERAHHHVLWSRVPNYQPDMLNTLLRKQHVFEYWAHAAAYLPMQDFRYSLPFKAAVRSGRLGWVRDQNKKLMRELLTRIQNEGPLRSRDVEQNKDKGNGWWDWKPAKKALEQLYMQGDLMVASRDGFQKTYDLPERVIPSDIDQTAPSSEEYAQYLIEKALSTHGFASLKGITYLRRDEALRQATKRIVDDLVAQQKLFKFTINASTPYLARPEIFDQTSPRTPRRIKILSPFDNFVIQRERLNDVFGYDYQIECYVPEPKRRYGYFCLPLLFGDQLVGRLDCKAHRQQGLLEVKNLSIEQGVDSEEIKQPLVAEIENFARFQNCQDITITKASNKTLSRLFE
ncbi:MAG: crosslink repair DNA glycosylase YcaQ family protein [Pseudomonadota bacterium]